MKNIHLYSICVAGATVFICLLDLFSMTIKRMAITLVREAWFNMKDFDNSRVYGIDKFSLKIKRKNIDGKNQWLGTFQCNNRKLEITAILKQE